MKSERACRIKRYVAPVFLLLLVLGKAVLAQDASTGSQAQWQPDLHWRLVGPFRGGRTRAATGVPDQPNVFYVGQVNGGVWKTTDFGRTWSPIFDNESSQSIGAIAVAPTDSNIVYVASGEGLRRPDLSVGNGIYRSGDAGKTWQHLGSKEGDEEGTTRRAADSGPGRRSARSESVVRGCAWPSLRTE